MEEGIRSLSRSLASFCNHLESSCYALKQSLDRRPIPLDSISSSFIKSLNRRVSSASGDLNVLDSMILGTVSFEELLGHCNEVYKKNQSDLSELQDRLKSLGYYVPDVEIGDEEEVPDLSTPLCLESKEGLAPPSSYFGQDCTTGSIIKSLEEDALLDESLSLKKLGLSDACLATLASGAIGQIESEDAEQGKHTICDVKQKSNEAPKPLINISIDDYESLPSYMKGLALWEDLLKAVEKINSSLSQKQRTKGSNYFHQDEISSLGLGPKARSYLLLLVRMNRLVVETIDGLISYRVL
ncbi:uncharacterized protein LOC121264151 isoform X2 [Juglans microcarpa x Juglans regia]|uniref:uncharacterized protein LOC121264151 isoform X2 n=1 Tax=Juglans microcarpa x Juglans regia TaxID=2249226 RepID=UPI001B7DC8DA|nr:uncharacterized protein LOC121264151 isoform X2 [Juglans microcarpa x Juglans regia]